MCFDSRALSETATPAALCHLRRGEAAQGCHCGVGAEHKQQNKTLFIQDIATTKSTTVQQPEGSPQPQHSPSLPLTARLQHRVWRAGPRLGSSRPSTPSATINRLNAIRNLSGNEQRRPNLHVPLPPPPRRSTWNTYFFLAECTTSMILSTTDGSES